MAPKIFLPFLTSFGWLLYWLGDADEPLEFNLSVFRIVVSRPRIYMLLTSFHHSGHHFLSLFFLKLVIFFGILHIGG